MERNGAVRAVVGRGGVFPANLKVSSIVTVNVPKAPDIDIFVVYNTIRPQKVS